MKRFTAACLFALILPALALALGGSHGKEKLDSKSRPDWPQGTAEMLNSQGWVVGHWVNSNDFFYYVGNIESLQKMIDLYGRLPETPLEIVINPGPRPTITELGEKEKHHYDWSVSIMLRGRGVPLDPTRPAGKPGYVITFNVHPSDQLDLSKLKYPKDTNITNKK